MPRRKNAMIPGALNRLQHEKSLYLLQHVENPVDWHPWGEEGRFYLWGTDEIRRLLDPEEARFAVEIFGLKEGGNFTDPVSGDES